MKNYTLCSSLKPLCQINMSYFSARLIWSNVHKIKTIVFAEFQHYQWCRFCLRTIMNISIPYRIKCCLYNTSEVWCTCTLGIFWWNNSSPGLNPLLNLKMVDILILYWSELVNDALVDKKGLFLLLKAMYETNSNFF